MSQAWRSDRGDGGRLRQAKWPDTDTFSTRQHRSTLTETTPTQDRLAEIFDLNRWTPRT